MERKRRTIIVHLFMGLVLLAFQACQTNGASDPPSVQQEPPSPEKGIPPTPPSTLEEPTPAPYPCWEMGPLSELDFLFNNSGFESKTPDSFITLWMASSGSELQSWFGRYLSSHRIKEFQPLIDLATQTQWDSANSVPKDNLVPIDLKCNLFEHSPQQQFINHHWQHGAFTSPPESLQDSVKYFIQHPENIKSDFVGSNLFIDASTEIPISLFRSLRLHRFDPENQWILFEVCYAFEYDEHGCFSQAAIWTHPVKHNTLSKVPPQEESLVLVKHFSPEGRDDIQAWQIRSVANPEEQGIETEVSFTSCHN